MNRCHVTSEPHLRQRGLPRDGDVHYGDDDDDDDDDEDDNDDDDTASRPSYTNGSTLQFTAQTTTRYNCPKGL